MDMSYIYTDKTSNLGDIARKRGFILIILI